MKVRKIPMRTCVVTKEQLPKKDLLRIVCDKTGCVTVDETGKANGRGAYIKKNLETLKKAQKSKILERRLECVIDEEIYQEIEEIIKKRGEEV